MIELKLTDNTGQVTLPELDVPLTISPIHRMTTVEVVSGNLYFDYVGTKRTWTATWAYMDEADFDILKGYVDRQLLNGVFPELTDVYHNVTNVVVYMTLTAQNIIDHCGQVQDVTVSFRETIQMSTVMGSS